MRSGGLKTGTARARLRLGTALLSTLIGWAGAEARDLTVTGTAMNGYGRILLEFDQPTKVTARTANGVLVLGFSDAVTFKAERLAAELPGFISLARRDPDGTGVRLALQKPLRANVLVAGERVFVDLLPENWVGLAPGLPADVVAELARRAEAAEARAEARRKAEERRPVRVRMAETAALTRLVFEPPGPVPASFTARGNEAELVLQGPLSFDAAELKGRLGGAVAALAAEPLAGALRIRLNLGPGYEAKGAADEAAFVVDVVKAAPPEPPPAPRSTPAEAVRAAPQPAGPVRPAVETRPDGVTLTFPFRGRTPAAAFARGDGLTLVFHTSEALDLPALPAAAEGALRLRGVQREGAFLVARFELREGRAARLTPRDQAWVLGVGEGGASAEPLLPARAHDEAGRALLAVPLPGVSGVVWIEDRDTGERIAVATAPGPARALVKPHRFAEFRLAPTLHGVAVVAEADDLVVRSGVDGVAVSRGGGLALSQAPPPARPQAQPLAEPILVRERWMRDQLGSTLAGWRERLDEVVAAPRSGRSAARLDLVRFLMANGLDAEAAGVLAVASAEDPALLRQRGFALLTGINAARLRRDALARRLLTADGLREDPEALLWRAVLDARARRWGPAFDGLRRSALLIDLYPDDVQGLIRPLTIRAALRAGDLAAAEAELDQAQGLKLGLAYREELELLRAVADEAAGRGEAALDTFRRLSESDTRPVAAEAALRHVALALGRGAMEPAEAMARLETVAVAWRGDDIEAQALGLLGRLYAEAGRWRDAFLAARTANRLFPDHDVTRTLHEATAQLFEDLFLSGKRASLQKVEALALFFDFKEFMPIGRRGDEIVRHLVDRLVELDLLEQAGDLLQHQVDKRLTGAARATVAARLALVRLTDGKPQAALTALRSTRLADLPAEMKRARALLEARALSDLSRTDLALEVLEAETGPDVERLRADIVWAGRRWREAGEVHERLAGESWRGSAPLSPQAISDVLRAAIAYGLAEESLALDRLRVKFAAKMADSPDAQTFAFLAQPNAAATGAFRDLARRVTSADTFAGFLAEYRKRYPEAAILGRPPQPDGARPSGARS